MRSLRLGFGVMLLTVIFGSGCAPDEDAAQEVDADMGIEEIKLITLDPGHFHAALVQKKMYPQINPVVHVYAPEGFELDAYLELVRSYNNRKENPTSWEEEVYAGEDYLERMLEEKNGNLVVLAGNNKSKTEYIKACVEAGLNVLADKPMCIDSAGYQALLEAFETAAANNVLIYDIMTERSEITTILQKELAHMTELAGDLVEGSAEEPAIVKESVHHFFKYVSGSPLQRPAWYFDTEQQGEGIVDVTNHLIDLIMWEAFPGQAIGRDEVEIVDSERWPTVISREQYERVTGVSEFPEYLEADLNEDGDLLCYANGQIDYKLRGVHCRVVVKWNYEAPEGAKDTHYSVMRGSRANILIRQGAEQDYRPELYVEPAEGVSREQLEAAMEEGFSDLEAQYPGIGLESTDAGWWITIPDEYRIGHEAHFAQVMERYLEFLEQGSLPEWEIANMKTRYALTTEALEKARE